MKKFLTFLKYNLRCRIWLIALISAVLFLYLPIGSAMSADSFSGGDAFMAGRFLARDFEARLSGYGLLLIIMAAAVILAFYTFPCLYKEGNPSWDILRKGSSAPGPAVPSGHADSPADNSVPPAEAAVCDAAASARNDREPVNKAVNAVSSSADGCPDGLPRFTGFTVFASGVISSILIFAVPYLIMSLASGLITAYAAGMPSSVGYAAVSCAINLGFFLLLYMTALLASLLAQGRLAGLLITCILCFEGTCISILADHLMTRYFDTYLSQTSFLHSLSRAASPAGWIFLAMEPCDAVRSAVSYIAGALVFLVCFGIFHIRYRSACSDSPVIRPVNNFSSGSGTKSAMDRVAGSITESTGSAAQSSVSQTGSSSSVPGTDTPSGTAPDKPVSPDVSSLRTRFPGPNHAGIPVHSGLAFRWLSIPVKLLVTVPFSLSCMLYLDSIMDISPFWVFFSVLAAAHAACAATDLICGYRPVFPAAVGCSQMEPPAEGSGKVPYTGLKASASSGSGPGYVYETGVGAAPQSCTSAIIQVLPGTLITIAASVAAAFILKFDALGYDSWLPSVSSVDSVGIYSTYLEDIYGSEETLELTELYGCPMLRYSYLTDSDVAGRMELTENIDDVFVIAESGIAAASDYEALTRESASSDGGMLISDMMIAWHLKGGRTVYRYYFMDMYEVCDELEKIYASYEFKTGCYPLLSLDEDGIADIAGADFQNEFGETLGPGRYQDGTGQGNFQEYIRLLYRTYADELTGLTLNERLNSFPITYIRFRSSGYEEIYRALGGRPDVRDNHGMPEAGIFDNPLADPPADRTDTGFPAGSVSSADLYSLSELDRLGWYPVYPSFTGTLALLEESGAGILNSSPSPSTAWQPQDI